MATLVASCMVLDMVIPTTTIFILIHILMVMLMLKLIGTVITTIIAPCLPDVWDVPQHPLLHPWHVPTLAAQEVAEVHAEMEGVRLLIIMDITAIAIKIRSCHLASLELALLKKNVIAGIPRDSGNEPAPYYTTSI